MSLSLRLAGLFAMVSMLLLSGIGVYLYQSLQREIVWRDDQALLGRVDRIRSIISSTEDLAGLSQRPQLYENMLGNRDNLLWVIDPQGRPIIDINPPQLPVPRVSTHSNPQLLDAVSAQPVRLAVQSVPYGSQQLTIIAGKLLFERQQMLATYQRTIALAVLLGTVLAFGLGWLISVRGLRPVRRLAAQAATIDVQHLDLRLQPFAQGHELAVLSGTLNQMLDRLERGFLQLSRFSEDLAHEMRTPLNNLLGQTSLALQQQRSAQDYQELLFSNQEEYERLARMIDNMLFLARAEQANAAIKPEWIQLADLVEQLCDYFEGMAEEQHVSLSNKTSGELWAEPELVRRALANLIANALRYADPNTTITIQSQQTAERLELSVSNQGITIEPDQIELIFQRFYRCDASRQHSGDSGGLGLAIVRSIMQLHQGQVSVNSSAKNTCFRLVFPNIQRE